MATNYYFLDFLFGFPKGRLACTYLWAQTQTPISSYIKIVVH
jgi:hypothetical protein